MFLKLKNKHCGDVHNICFGFIGDKVCSVMEKYGDYYVIAEFAYSAIILYNRKMQAGESVLH